MVIVINVNYDKSGIHLSIPPVIALIDCAVVLYSSIQPIYGHKSLSQCSAIYGQVKICIKKFQEDCIRYFIHDICNKVFFKPRFFGL